jgi:hypothetical protein
MHVQLMSEYRNDIHSAHAKISSLEREKDELHKKLADKEKRVKCKECGGRWHRIRGLAVTVFWGVLAAVVGLAGAGFIYMAVVQNGPTGTCYVKGDGLTFKLVRTIDWGSDETIGTYRSMDEDLTDAEKVKCQVK